MKCGWNIALLAAAWVLGAAGQAAAPPVLEFSGMCDASGAAAIDGRRFVVACNDDSRLRIYASDRPGPPESVVDLTSFLRPDPAEPGTDIEAATRVGDLIYWLTSHGRSARGHYRPSRHRFFGTRVEVVDTQVRLRPEGVPYTRLLEDLLAAPSLKSLRLASAAGLPPEAGGLNLEGIAGGADGSLWLGFRSPVPSGRALLAPLLNPTNVLAGQAARFGEPAQLDLGGLGVRDLLFRGGRFLIIGGPAGDEGRFRLFDWPGPGAPAVALRASIPKGLHPEALVDQAGTNAAGVLVLSDDGGREINGCRCKELPDPAKKRFQAFWLELKPEEPKRRRK